MAMRCMVLCVGLYQDDTFLTMNNPMLKESMNRLTADEAAEYMYRGSRSHILYQRKAYLPREEWTKLEDVSYIKKQSYKS